MPFSVYFDSPRRGKKITFYKQGGSPELLQQLINYIDTNKEDIEEIDFCWYLFNNKILYDYLKDIATADIKVNIITIPRAGYDIRNPKRLEDFNSGEKSEKHYSKYDLASEIFSDAFYDEKTPNLQLSFFPHIYVRSKYVKQFSRGDLPYSLHIKTCFIKF